MSKQKRKPPNKAKAEAQPPKRNPLHIDAVPFEDVQRQPLQRLVAVCHANDVDPVGTAGDLRARLRAFKIGRAGRENEKHCTQCGNRGRPTSGPRTQSHTVSRQFKCEGCGRLFTVYQDTQKGGA